METEKEETRENQTERYADRPTEEKHTTSWVTHARLKISKEGYGHRTQNIWVLDDNVTDCIRLNT